MFFTTRSSLLAVSASAACLGLAGAVYLGVRGRWHGSASCMLPRALQLLLWRLQQRRLRSKLIEHDLCDVSSIRLIGGVDISFIKGSETDACAALVVLDASTLEVVYESYRRVALT